MSEEKPAGWQIIENARNLLIADVVGSLGYRIIRGGRFSPCPACGGDSDRVCGIFPKQPERWSCLSCNRGGSAVDLAMAIEGEDRVGRATMQRLEEWTGTPLKKVEVDLQRESPLLRGEEVRRHWDQMRMTRAVAEWCEGRGLGKSVIHADLIRAAHWRHLPTKRKALVSAARKGELIAMPLRSTKTGEVCNVMLRRTAEWVWGWGERHKPLKTMALNKGAGTIQHDGHPLCYAGPGADSSKSITLVILTEGGPDTLTAADWTAAIEAEGVLCLGAVFAGHIARFWEKPLKKWDRPVVVVPHLDKADKQGRRAGPDACKELLQQLGDQGRLFDWKRFRKMIGTTDPKDLNDVAQAVNRDVCLEAWAETYKGKGC